VRHLLIPCLVICIVVLGGVVGVLGDDDAVAVPPIMYWVTTMLWRFRLSSRHLIRALGCFMI